MTMEWYPWLNITYRRIIAHYQKGQGHHALLLHSKKDNGKDSLIYALSRWLICHQPYGIKSCGICRSCQLMKAGNHPDYYQYKLKKGQQSLGIDSIRIIINNIQYRAHQGGVKVVCFTHSERLTEQAANALLKTLEEPPAQTYFILECQEPSYLLPTILSRCLCWSLPLPTEKLGLRWLQQQVDCGESRKLRSALRLCGGSPLAAQDLLQPARWQERLSLCIAITKVIESGDFLVLLPLLNRDSDDEPLYWLISLLIDALKWKQGVQQNYLVNIDQIDLVITLATRWSTMALHQQLQHWLAYRYQWQKVNGINQELLLTYYLLSCEQNTRSPCITYDNE